MSPRDDLPRALRAVTALVATSWAAAASAQAPDFSRDVAPLLARSCVECHGPTEQKVGLRLDQRAAALAGSDFGAFPVIVPGARDESLLFELVRDGHMPPAGGVPFTAEEVEALGRWIDAGADWPDDGEEASWPTRHWSYQPVERPPVPDVASTWPRNEVDRFLFAAMAGAGLAPSPEAPRGVLLRRASLDLLGLPPDPEDLAAFLADERPDAWERAVDRLLASPHYGEQQARRWLDLARYADSNGYEKDADRSIWPWRDWVVESFNRDVPFDRFTVEQLAGDLLPDATEAQRVATGFHRNTMTNDEGGTDPEEFRVAAVVDRVNTTGEVWLGTTMGCAQCHDHKVDPVTQRDYYRMFAVFNQTSDDGKRSAPTLGVPRARDRELFEAIAAEEAVVRAQYDEESDAFVADREAWVARTRELLTGPETLARADVAWVDDGAPPATRLSGDWRPWAGPGGEGTPAPRSGARAVVQEAEGFEQFYFEGARAPLVVGEDDRFFVHVWIDPARPTRELFLQFHERGGDWEHRAYLGEDLHGWGTPGTAARRPYGGLPGRGAWVRVEVDPRDVGFEPGDAIDGMAFGQVDGRVWWDDAGLVTASARNRALVPDDVAAALLDGDDELPDAALDWHRETTPFLEPLRASLDELAALRPPLAQTMVLEAVAEPRATHVLERGSFLSPGEEVGPAVPAVLDPDRATEVEDRLDLARWLVAPENPLTARVTANRLWAWTFGRGLVATLDDFGTQGEAPTHPALLDWLAAELVADDWSVKRFYRRLLTSAAYRQAAVRPAHADASDPRNRLLSWFPRRRLDGEELRDQALAVAGTLDRTLGGPPVYPPQPDGTDNATYAGDRWRTSEGAEALRRGLYTFWRRTSPYPSFLLFDAPSRELTCASRDRSNTPLQALALLNDPTYVAAAEAFGARLADEGLAAGFLRCTGREADGEELAVLDELRTADGWTSVAQVLLNLDETVTRP